MLAATAWAAAPAYAATCTTRVASDFNGDGWADLLVGEPGAEDGGIVRVLYGTSSGISATNNQIIKASLGTGDHQFGHAVTTGFFNADCYADAAIGAPGTSQVLVVWGAATGLHTQYGPSVGLSPTTFTEDPSELDGLGASLAAADINGDGVDDLAIGAPGGDGGAGAVAVVYGLPSGEEIRDFQLLNQSTSGVPGSSEEGDAFGFSLAFGDFNGDSRKDLAVGAPAESVGSDQATGTVVVLPSNGSMLTSVNSKGWTQDTSGVPGSAESFDLFGFALATGDVNGDKRAELMIGAPGEAIGDRAFAGAVTMLRGSSSGLTANGAKSFHQDTSGVPGTAEEGDGFGLSVTMADFNGDGYADVVASSPDEQIGTKANTGLVTVLYSNKSTLTTTGIKSFAQSTSGVVGSDETGDEFGWWVTSVKNPTGKGSSLVVGSYGEAIGSSADTGAVTVLRSGTGGLTGTGSVGFNPTTLTDPTSGGHFGASIS
jgi:hypothetical protein